MKHIHHVIPRHMGGTDDESNLVELSIEEHAEAHKKLYEEHGRWEDYLAWQGLAGLMTRAELVAEMLKRAGQKGGSNQTGKKRGKYKRHKNDYKPVGTGGSKWYHNPDDPSQKGCFKDGQEIPDGWTRGQGKKSKNPGLNFHAKKNIVAGVEI